MGQPVRVTQHPLVGIEEAANAAVAREDESPTITSAALVAVKKSATVRVGGFVINDETAEQDATNGAIEKRKEAVARYKNDRDQIALRLQEREITPLAVVPKAAWERLCNQSGLFMICPDDSGNVRVSGAVLDGFGECKKALLKYLFWTLMAVSAITFGCVTRFVLPPGAPHILYFIAPVVGVIVAYVVFGLIFYDDNNERARWEGRMVKLQIKLFTMRSWKNILTKLLPDGKSPDYSGSARNQLYVKVVLPQPPADVASVLLKARGMTLHVATVAHAIAFAEPVGDILEREHKRIMDEEAEQRERERRARLDPIIYIESGSAVAIIAQFGDFPIEQRVVNQVMNSEFLL